MLTKFISIVFLFAAMSSALIHVESSAGRIIVDAAHIRIDRTSHMLHDHDDH